jgi:hypothetical protein
VVRSILTLVIMQRRSNLLLSGIQALRRNSGGP